MTKSPRSFKNSFVWALGLFFLIACKSGEERTYQQIFCDSCESAVVKAVFAADSVQVFYKDYSDLNQIADAILPIDDRYLGSIDTRNFKGDSSILSHFNGELVGDYRRAIGLDSNLNRGTYPDLEKAIMPLRQIRDSYGKRNSGKYIRISKPVFSADRTFALVEIDYYCSGLCGEGNTYILTKKGDGWVQYKKIMRWVS